MTIPSLFDENRTQVRIISSRRAKNSCKNCDYSAVLINGLEPRGKMEFAPDLRTCVITNND